MIRGGWQKQPAPFYLYRKEDLVNKIDFADKLS
mgnify:CR=1 FL=1